MSVRPAFLVYYLGNAKRTPSREGPMSILMPLLDEAVLKRRAEIVAAL
jgi:hypothetical protein